MKIYLVHFNHDYHEWTRAFRLRYQAIESIGEAFGIDLTEYDYDSKEFWDAVLEVYETSNWKGLTFYVLDTETLKFSEAM